MTCIISLAKTACHTVLYVTFAKWDLGGNAKDKLAILQYQMGFIGSGLPFMDHHCKFILLLYLLDTLSYSPDEREIQQGW